MWLMHLYDDACKKYLITITLTLCFRVDNPSRSLDLLYVAHASIKWCMQKVFIKTTLTLCFSSQTHQQLWPVVCGSCIHQLMHAQGFLIITLTFCGRVHNPTSGLLYGAYAAVRWCMQKVFINSDLDIISEFTIPPVALTCCAWCRRPKSNARREQGEQEERVLAPASVSSLRESLTASGITPCLKYRGACHFNNSRSHW